MVLAVPSRDGLEAAHAAVRALLGWEDVAGQLETHQVDPFQAERLRRRLREARERVPEIVRQAYGVVVTVNEQNEVQAFKLPAGAGALFPAIKNDERARIKETAVDAEALLPDGPYDLWRDDDDARRVTDLVGAFARYPRLPKLLHPKVLLDTVLQGVESRWLEVADDSVAVHCRYDEAGQLRLKRPAAIVDPAPPPTAPSVAGALLEGSQIQDLAELVPKLLEASAGNDLRFRVGATLNQDAGEHASENVRAALNALLATVSANLQIE